MACAIGYISGWASYDIIVLFDIALTVVCISIWQVMTAINMVPEFPTSYSVNYDYQNSIARRFQEMSSAGIGNCVGAKMGCIWTSMSTEEGCNDAECAALKFLCGQKHNYQMNYPAVGDSLSWKHDESVCWLKDQHKTTCPKQQ